MRLGVVQFSVPRSREAAVDQAVAKVREAAENGCGVILLPELFSGPYFCQVEDPDWFGEAKTVEEDPAVAALRRIAAELRVVVPVSFFERFGQSYFNSLALVDADSSVVGVYRKTHIPDGPGYEEKFYFTPGAGRPPVWETRFGKLGLAVCWDQWFPEVARSLVLRGADVLLYPTAIGSEPEEPETDTMAHWRRVMQGHAGANIVPVAAANRTGPEVAGRGAITFYGSSFITDPTGALSVEAGRTDETLLIAEIDPEANRKLRANWGFFRDRRPELYGDLVLTPGWAAS